MSGALFWVGGSIWNIILGRGRVGAGGDEWGIVLGGWRCVEMSGGEWEVGALFDNALIYLTLNSIKTFKT